MRPDLFAGPVQGNDSFRILARLANGGSVPAPVRRLSLGRMQKTRLMAVTTLLAVGTLAWLWLQNVREAQLPPAVEAAHAATATSDMPSTSTAARPDAARLAALANAPQAAQPQAATIVSQPESPPPPQPQPPSAKDAPPPMQAAPQAMAAPPRPGQAVQESRSIRTRPARPGVAQAMNAPPPARGQRRAAPVEGDEDVALLAAMLKHAKPQKPPASPPAKE